MPSCLLGSTLTLISISSVYYCLLAARLSRPIAASLTADGVLKVEQPSCQDFCETTLELSGMRQRILDDVRQSSVASRVLAEVFDRQRGTSQDSKVAALYDRKTCAGVIAGVDRT